MRISELISKMAATGDTQCGTELYSMFPEAVFGLLVDGLPSPVHGRKIVVDGSGAVTMQIVTDPSGKRMVKACADPDLFDLNYPGCINVTITGGELLEMAEQIPNADGILVCSATSFHSFAIYRATYDRIKRAKGTGGRRADWPTRDTGSAPPPC